MKIFPIIFALLVKHKAEDKITVNVKYQLSDSIPAALQKPGARRLAVASRRAHPDKDGKDCC